VSRDRPGLAECRVGGGASCRDSREPIVSVAARAVRPRAGDAGVFPCGGGAGAGAFEVEFASGARMRITGRADPATGSAIVKGAGRR
jgi:hypothetical protein